MNYAYSHIARGKAAYAYPRPKTQHRPAKIHVNEKPGNGREPDFSPPVDVVRSDQRLMITAEIAGADSDSLSVTVRNGNLVLKGHKPPLEPSGHGPGPGPERQSGQFSEQIPLPDGADIQRIEAAYERGILSVNVPLTDDAGSGTIPIHQS